ncbi:uncharacterized protein JCM15063_002656 [Sporobolomyces koalae]|uniref:uncharacterized protein n=1 Tax=Sporobolomyces koalae TaxID=500713 RepID=UPI00316AF16D
MPFGRIKPHAEPAPTSPVSASDPSDIAQTETELAQTHELPPRINTQATNVSSSSSEEVPSPRSSISSRLPLSRLHHAVSRGASISSHSSTKSLPEPETPLQLAELAISTLLTIPGPSIEQLRHECFPKLFHDAYSHRVNTRELGLKELEQMIERLRSKIESMRVRFRSHVIDLDGSASMQVAAIGITYDVFIVPHHHHEKGEHRRDIEERKSHVMAVVKIFEGRLAQSDIVLDTTPFQDAHMGPQLAQCSIM